MDETVHGSGIIVWGERGMCPVLYSCRAVGLLVNGDARMAGDQHNGPERELTGVGEARRGVGRPAERDGWRGKGKGNGFVVRCLCFMHNARLALHR